MQFIVIARDGADEGAKERRQAVREEHLVKASQLKEAGSLLMGGALLSEAGEMIGSALIIEAASEEEARRIVEADIYTRAGVWVSYEIWPFRKAM